MPKLVILWTAPRSLSTAVYQSVTTLKSTRVKCFFELFMHPYCFGPPHPTLSPERELPVEPTYSAVTQILQQSYPGIDLVFTKEMAKCLPAKGTVDYKRTLEELAHAQHVFLIRDPGQVVYSRYKVNQKEPTGYQTYSETDAGLMELYNLYDYIQVHFDPNPLVIDTSDILNNPSEMMKILCEGVGVEFEPDMVNWEPGSVDIVMPINDWDVYLESVKRSSGFITIPYSEQTTVPINELTPDMLQYVHSCQPGYELLRRKCIKPQ